MDNSCKLISSHLEVTSGKGVIIESMVALKVHC